MKFVLFLPLIFSINTYALIQSGEKITSTELDNIKSQVEYKRKCVTKELDVDTSFIDLPNVVGTGGNNRNGLMNSMQITGLTIGHRYEVFLDAYFLNISASQHELRVYNANDATSNFITRLRAYNANNSVSKHYQIQTSEHFIASNGVVSVSFSINSGTSGSLISGSTRIKVCEANHREDVSSF